MSGAGWWRMTCGPASVTIRTHLRIGEAVRQQRREGYAPLFGLATAPVGGDGAQVVHEPTIDRDVVQFDRATRRLTVRALGPSIDAHRLLHLAYLLLEVELQRHGYLTLHAAAVASADRAVLLLGHSGAGKTATALLLCRDHGCRLVGNDLVVVGGSGTAVETLAGTTHLRLRHSSIARAAPDLLDLFPGSVADPWRTKIDASPHALGVQVADRPAALGPVVFVRVDRTYPSLVVARGDTLTHRLNLHENALRYVRGGSTPWLVGAHHRYGPYVPPLDDEAAHAARIATLERLMGRACYVAGAPEAVAECVLQLLIDGASAAAPEGSRS